MATVRTCEAGECEAVEWRTRSMQAPARVSQLNYLNKLLTFLPERTSCSSCHVGTAYLAGAAGAGRAASHVHGNKLLGSSAAC